MGPLSRDLKGDSTFWEGGSVIVVVLRVARVTVVIVERARGSSSFLQIFTVLIPPQTWPRRAILPEVQQPLSVPDVALSLLQKLIPHRLALVIFDSRMAPLQLLPGDQVTIMAITITIFVGIVEDGDSDVTAVVSCQCHGHLQIAHSTER